MERPNKEEKVWLTKKELDWLAMTAPIVEQIRDAMEKGYVPDEFDRMLLEEHEKVCRRWIKKDLRTAN